jgi:DMSO/TMAO reductase YedYZ heme-binding membrane subunit
MAATYKPVIWNRHKRVYDGVIAAGVALYLAVFIAVNITTADSANTSLEILLISALGGCAFVMLHIILAIGPLARISPVFLPLLYNRRHLGVAMFIVAASHATYATIWYHGYGVLNPLVSIFVSNPRYDAIDTFPFESLGAFALVIIFLMAATSHDFWLNNLSPAVWKTLHMLVYVAYALLVLHVILGTAVEDRANPLHLWTIAAGFAAIVSLHLIAAIVQAGHDRSVERPIAGDWVDAGPASAIPDKRARIVTSPEGDQIAIFRYDGKVSAVSNVCAHQMGPLGEGCIVDGLVTCRGTAGSTIPRPAARRRPIRRRSRPSPFA